MIVSSIFIHRFKYLFILEKRLFTRYRIHNKKAIDFFFNKIWNVMFTEYYQNEILLSLKKLIKV